jgi:hypothetical protein
VMLRAEQQKEQQKEPQKEPPKRIEIKTKI